MLNLITSALSRVERDLRQAEEEEVMGPNTAVSEATDACGRQSRTSQGQRFHWSAQWECSPAGDSPASSSRTQGVNGFLLV